MGMKPHVQQNNLKMKAKLKMALRSRRGTKIQCSVIKLQLILLQNNLFFYCP